MTTLHPLTIHPTTESSRDTSLEVGSFQSSRHDLLSDDTRTPTRDSFAAANGKRTLPMSPTEEEPPSDLLSRGDLRREGSHRSSNSQAIQDQDIDMGLSEEEAEGSENDSQDDDTERPSKKKKKGQRFFCTEYPPCNLSFTRSEHLARHIRKHTGERPFQCHCSRRFSRLDNLRQHAQTVHVNEDIPGDSLAATGTRFQRQIRTDRIRPQGARARASTGGSQSGHRGHGRNLSTSSIASTASHTSTLSRENSSHRPHSMTLGDHRRGGLTIDTLRASPTHNYAYTHQPSSGNSTPTSYYAGGTPSSPFGSTLGSPITIARNTNNGSWADRHMVRRLSVPSGTSVFQAGGQAPQFQNQFSTINPSSNSSTVGSPTSSTFSPSRSDVTADDWRRRTWHPNTYSNYSYPRPATSGLSYSQTPNEPGPAFAPQALAAAGQTTKLPGIEAFDQMSNRPSTPPPRVQPPPNAAITPNRMALHPAMDRRQPGHGHQRGVHSWDMSLHQNLTRLEITSDTPPRDTGGWVQQQIFNPVNSLQSSPQHPAAQPNHVATSGPPMQVPPQLILPSQPVLTNGPLSQDPSLHQGESPPRPLSQPHAMAPPGSQRTGWPVTMPHKLMQRPGPSSRESSSGESIHTPITYRDYQPQVIHANGYIEPRSSIPGPKYAILPNYQQMGHPRSPEFYQRPDTSGLDALVAVATSESRQMPAQR